MNLPLPVHLDFETFSAANLKATGASRYAADPSTEILCLGYAFGDEEPELWTPIDPPPADLFDAIADGAHVHAWNTGFEIPVWACVAVGKLGWPEVPLRQWRDPQAVALSYALPAALDDAGAALGLKIAKDPRGKHLVNKLSKPRRASKKDPRTRWTYEMASKDYEDLYEYCRQDVRAERAVQAALPTNGLTKSELATWRLTVEMNLRGWTIDVESVDALLEALAQHETQALEEIVTLTGGAVDSPRQRDRSLRWLVEQGASLPDLTADTVEATLRNGKVGPFSDPLPDQARRFLELRRELAPSSTKKLVAMKARICEDGTVKDLLQYHGAATGRDAGRGIQIQNFPRKSVGDQAAVRRAVDTLRYDYPRESIEILYGPVPEFASKLLRPMLVAAPDHELVAADFSSIENRVTVWLAGCEYGMDIFRRGLDEYRVFASRFYQVSYDQVTGEQRQHAKAAVLGCFAAGTRVLTDRGFVPIEKVEKTDRVWDGVEWVSHDGVAYQGEKEVLCLEGVRVTPEHEILTPTGWSTADHLARVGNTPSLRSAIDMAASWLRASCEVLAEGSEPSPFDAIVDGRGVSIPTPCGMEGRRPVETAPGNEPPRHFADGDTSTSCLTILSEPDGVTGTRRCSRDATTPDRRRTGSMGLEGSESVSPGTIERSSFEQSRRSRIGRTSPSTSTESTPSETMNRETSGWSLTPRTSGIVVPVYDVVNAGPRKRFTILTDAGPLVVHNCCFGMGAPKMVAQAASFGRHMELEDAKETVNGYRRIYKEVPATWYELERRAKLAIQEGRRTSAAGGKIHFQVEGRFLFMTLPSGRRLAYPDPLIEDRMTPWGEMKLIVTHAGFLVAAGKTTRKWGRPSLIPGRIMENAVQAAARDAMMEGAHRTTAAGYDLVGRVHDELVSQVPRGQADLEAYCRLMTSPQTWLTGIPVEASGWVGHRYRKD